MSSFKSSSPIWLKCQVLWIGTINQEHGISIFVILFRRFSKLCWHTPSMSMSFYVYRQINEQHNFSSISQSANITGEIEEVIRENGNITSECSSIMIMIIDQQYQKQADQKQKSWSQSPIQVFVVPSHTRQNYKGFGL